MGWEAVLLLATGVPGVAYAVVSDGKIKTVGARGVVKSGGDQEVTPDTPFVAGSISKSFTALAVMQGVEAGKIDLDAEISRYLDISSNKQGASITIRQLLSHMSGYSTLQGNRWHPSTVAKDELARWVNAGSGMGFSETAQLRKGITARTLGLDYDGESSRWSQRALFLAMALMPIVFLLCMVWAWLHRAEIRAKSGAFGLFSLWFPVLTTLCMPAASSACCRRWPAYRWTRSACSSRISASP